MQPPLDDARARQLLQACAVGDQKALVELHRMLARHIHAFAWQRLRSDEDAQTVVIDTLHEVWKSAARFRGESLVSTWVLGIARFKAMALRRQTPAAEAESQDIDDHAETLASDAEDGEAAPARWQQLQRYMCSLTPAHRKCLQLVYYEGLGVAEVALVQQVPQGTVKRRLFHGQRQAPLVRHEHEPMRAAAGLVVALRGQLRDGPGALVP